MLTTEQKSGQLYKHFLNVSDTRDNRDFYEESIQSSFCIRPDQLLMYGDQIPRGDNQSAIDAIRNLKDGEYFNYQKDETTVIHVVQYHENYQLVKIDNGTDNAFKLVDSDGNPLQNIIPFNYYKDLYNYELKTKSGEKIYFGVGDWVLDTFSGVLKFYGDVPPGIDHDNPPTLSFYQYVGGTGFRQDTFGYDGVIVPINGWHISDNTYIIDETNTLSDGSTITIENQIVKNANAIQDNYAAIFGFDGSDTNEGIAYSLEPIISLTYTSTKDNVKGYDDSANSDIGIILTRKSALVDSEKFKITFCSENVSINKEHTIEVVDGTASFDGGSVKTISDITKLSDVDGNFIVIEPTTNGSIGNSTYKITVSQSTTNGIMLYWSKADRDYIPYVNKEDDYFNFGFPVVTANGRIPPSVSIGTLTLSQTKDSITPEYYGPRIYTITVALEDEFQTKSADYVVKNRQGFYLDDILKRIISDHTTNGTLDFKGTIFLRAGTYKLSDTNLDIGVFKNLVLKGEDKHTTIISGNVSIENDSTGLITIDELTFNNLSNITLFKTVTVNECIVNDIESTKGNNTFYVKNTSISSVKIVDSNKRVNGTIELSEVQISELNDKTETWNTFVGCSIGSFSSNTGHTTVNGCNVSRIKLYDVVNDNIKSCFINVVDSKPSQTTLIESTVINYENTAFTEIPHMKHFPIYSQNSSYCLEYATFEDPFIIKYNQNGNTIGIKLDPDYLTIDSQGRLSCNLTAEQIFVYTEQISRNSSYEGKTIDELKTVQGDSDVPRLNFQQALVDIYATKADLNPDGKVPLAELPDSVAYGGLLLVGTWSFEYQDNVNGKAEDNYYVDGGKYPIYADKYTSTSDEHTDDDEHNTYKYTIDNEQVDKSSSGKIGDLRIKAKVPGSDGNKISVEIIKNTEGLYVVTTTKTDDNGNIVTTIVQTAGVAEELNKNSSTTTVNGVSADTTGNSLVTFEGPISEGTVNLTGGMIQLQAGWFWIVASSKKDIDKPATVQTAALQDGETEPLKFTAGDWIIWNGSKFEKLDRAYQDVAYMVLPVYTTGEHLHWSWRDTTENKAGLGALDLVDSETGSGVTIAEGFDMINQELKKLQVKMPAFLGTLTLEPYYDDYKSLNYYPIDGEKASAIMATAYDLHKDPRTIEFRVRTPITNPKWKSSIWTGDKCTFEATVDGNSTRIDYTTDVDNEKEIIPGEDNTSISSIHISKAFDPYADELTGKGYWKSVNVDFAGKDFIESPHKFVLGITDISPYNEKFTNGSISMTPVFTIDTVDKLDFESKASEAVMSESGNTIVNTDNIKSALNAGYCSGITTINGNVLLEVSFSVDKAIDCVNIDRKIIRLNDKSNNISVDIPESCISFTNKSEDGVYDIEVENFKYNLPVDKICNDKQDFTVSIFDVYGNEFEIPLNLSVTLRIRPNLNELERVRSGTGLYPTVNTKKVTTCGYPFDSSIDLANSAIVELQKDARIINVSNVDGTTTEKIVYEYAWPDGRYYDNYNNKDFDYTATTKGDIIVEDEEPFRWVTFTKVWNNETSCYETITLDENSGFTLDINVVDDKDNYFTVNKYSMATSENDFKIYTKLVDYTLDEDCGLTKWMDCNSPYDGFAEVGTVDGQAAMYAGSSSKYSKRITFGTKTYSGTLIFRVGIRKGSNLAIENLSVRNLI